MAMENENKPLWEEIVDFTKSKNKLAVALIALGLLGLVLPILPGLLLIAVGIYLLKPACSLYPVHSPESPGKVLGQPLPKLPCLDHLFRWILIRLPHSPATRYGITASAMAKATAYRPRITSS